MLREHRTEETPVRVLVVHYDRLCCDGLATALAHQHNIMVVGNVTTVRALEALGASCPDVIIIDLAASDVDSLRGLQGLHRVFPEAKLLMKGLSESPTEVWACAEAGIAAYLPKDASLDELLLAVRAVVAEGAFCPPKVVSSLFSQIAENARKRTHLPSERRVHLTPREREITALLQEGLSNKEIAVRLHIELYTVKNHVRNILKKLRLKSRREVAWYTREMEVLPLANL